MKRCTKCGVEKELECFVNALRGKICLRDMCIGCRKERMKRLYKKRNKKHKKKRLEWYVNNKEKKRKDNKEFHKKNKGYYKKYYENNKEKCAKKNHKWRENNKEAVRNNRNIKNKIKYKTNPIYKFQKSLRSRTLKAFKRRNWKKTSKTFDLLGSTPEVVFKHLEDQFIEGMSWDNHGEWHIDHIIPLAIADNESELEILCFYENLQPLWAYDNLSKGCKILE